MVEKESPPDAAGFVRTHGEEIARLFLLLVPDRLDAEDLFHAFIVRLLARRSAPPVLPSAVRTAFALAERQARSERRSQYKPVEIDSGRGSAGRVPEPLRSAWSRVPLSERSAIVLLFGFGGGSPDRAPAIGAEGADLLAAAEHGLLLFSRELGGRGRLPAPPRGTARGELLRARLAGEKLEEARAPEGAGRAARDIDFGIKRFQALRRSSLPSSAWARMRRRALRELPSPGASSEALLVDSFETAFGWFSVASLDAVLVGTSFGRMGEGGWSRVIGAAGASAARQDPRALRAPRRELEEYFRGARKRFTFPYRLVGVTSFRASVLDACAKIPYGSVRSYKQIAEGIGRPHAMRAVGGALGRNPLPVVIPCHRVIAETGFLSGFSAGLPLKERLLSLEGIGDLFAPGS
jgi:O-6-methylguanine DNA methyltransferase